jgi:3-hydroxyacyl-[acyl-carrier-protein] dehydratase
VLFLLEGASTEPGKVISPHTIFFTGCEGVRAHRVCRPGDILTLSIKPKRMKMPLATFEGAIRVGQEKAAIAEEITMTFGFAEAISQPVPVNGAVAKVNGENGTHPTPLRAAVNG